MGKTKFTLEQIELLRQNPNVKNVSEFIIMYTDEFKEKFAAEYAAGKPPSIILIEAGFDPKMLGKKRRDGLVRRVKEYSERPSGFVDTRTKEHRQSCTKELSVEEKIKKLEHQVKYLEQENEFLKKIEFLDAQAEKKAVQKKLRQKKSSHS